MPVILLFGTVDNALSLFGNAKGAFKSLSKAKFSWRGVFTELNASLFLGFLVYLAGALSVKLVENAQYSSQSLLDRVTGDSVNFVFVILLANAALLLVSGFYSLVSRFVGGKGAFKLQTLLLSRVFSAGVLAFAALLFLNDAFHILNLYTGLGPYLLTLLGGLAVAVWLVYAVYSAIKFANSLDFLKALSVFLSLVIFAAVAYSAYFVAYAWLFSAPSANVLVVGSPINAEDGTPLFNSEYFRLNGVTYIGTVSPDSVMPGTLERADYVVVEGVRECNRDARAEFARYLQAGGKLVLVGDACTEFQGAKGWSIGENNFGGLLPVAFVGNENVDSRLRIYAADDPLFNGILGPRVSGEVTRVRMKDSGVLLAFISNGDSYSEDSLPGIVHGYAGSGEAYYFAFDATKTSRELWLNLFNPQRSG